MTESELYEALGRKIAGRRQQLRLTQAQVAEAVGLSRASLANIEAGRQRVFIHQLVDLEKALEASDVTKSLGLDGAFALTKSLKMFGDIDLNDKQMRQVQDIVGSSDLRRVGANK